METIAWTATVLLSLCGIPQAIKIIREGQADGISTGFIIMYLIGSLFNLIYVVSLGELPLITGTAIGILCVSTYAYYKIFPR
jgi:uncharacterized protein with PQ loop repeat